MPQQISILQKNQAFEYLHARPVYFEKNAKSPLTSVHNNTIFSFLGMLPKLAIIHAGTYLFYNN